VDLDTVLEATGIDLAQLDRVARLVIESQGTVVCWAMGLTQHRHAVPMISEIANILLLRGMIGKPGAGLCPVRGHSNVQGDRTMGIWEKMPERFLAALDTRFGIISPREHGLDTVDAIRAMRDGRAKVFMGMGGNFALATPDTAVTETALRNCSLTVQVSTKLNRSHLVTGREALILPSLGRTDRDIQGEAKQQVSVEDSMSMVHLSRGSLQPPSPHVRSEPAIICQLARVLLGPDHSVPWERFNADYDTIRDAIAAVVPGCEDYNVKVRQPDGFQLPHPPRDSREFPTSSGKANFAVNPLQWVPVPPGRLVLQTLRSHDQYNTTIYGLDDRYRGVKGSRQVVFVNPADIAAFGLRDGDRVDLVSEFVDGDGRLQERRANDFQVVPYATPVGNAAAYYPETNPLVALDHVAVKSNTPVSKAIVIRLEASQGVEAKARRRAIGQGDSAAAGPPPNRGGTTPSPGRRRSRWRSRRRSASTTRRSP
jgi:molybdopterin-dependent oxidoreductase alpha subunit